MYEKSTGYANTSFVGIVNSIDIKWLICSASRRPELDAFEADRSPQLSRLLKEHRERHSRRRQDAEEHPGMANSGVLTVIFMIIQ